MIVARLRLTLFLLAAALGAGHASAALAVNLARSFEGLSDADNTSITGIAALPPDDNLGVGPDHVFQMTNIVGRITNKSGGALSSFSLNSFFNVDSAFDESDPRVIYDAGSGRWLATYLQFSFPMRRSSIILAVSATSDPTGVFCRYRLGNPTTETFIQDFPMLGVSDDKVVVSYNGFRFINDSFMGAGYYVVKKDDLSACAGSLTVSRVAPSVNAATIHPAQSLSTTADLYMAEVLPGGTTVRVYRVSGVPGSTLTTATSLVPIRTGTPPVEAPQLGSAVLLDTSDGRIESATWQNSSLWLSGPESCTPTGDVTVRSCLRILEIRTDTMTAYQDITFGAPGQYYYHPALRPDAFDNLHVVFSSSSSSSDMDVRVTGRAAGDALNTLQASTQLRAGGGAQTASSGRTGDYSGAAVDPSAPETVWVMGEYTASTGLANWGTFVAQLQFDNPAPSIGSVAPSSTAAGGAPFTLTVNGSGFVSTSVVRWNGADRATTFVSTAQLTASIAAGDLLDGGTVTVTVLNSAPGGGTSAGQAFTINNPVPSLGALLPNLVLAGSAGGAILTVTGSNFVLSSVVRWNGSNRTTRFESGGQLAVDIPAADLASGAVVQVTVFNPGPAGGTSGAATFTINNPVPSLVSLSPSSVVAGSAVFTLTLNGGNFVPTSVVRWNGAELAPPTFVSAFKLTELVPAADIAAADSASVTVFNGAPAGGTSGAATFTITPAPTFSLTVSVKGSAPGAVTSAPAAITCPATCAADFASGASVTLTAQAGSGAIFKAWSGACSDASVTCVVSMTAARSVTATFSKVFTDSTLTAGGSVVAAAHVLDLRSAIDALRTQYRLASYAWSNALAGGSTLVRAIDLAEVRAALEATYVAAGVAPPTYSDPTIAAGETVIKASHVTEARNAVRAIE